MRTYDFLKQRRRPESWTNYRAGGRREGMRSRVGVAATVMGEKATPVYTCFRVGGGRH